MLAAGLRERGATVEVLDGLEVAGALARAVAGAPRLLDFPAGHLVVDAAHAVATGAEPLRRGAEHVATRRLRATLAAHPADAIVSTSPLHTPLLGAMRAAGTLATPVASAVTELAGLRGRAHPGVDLHMLVFAESEGEVRAVAGAGARVEAVHGLTDPRLLAAPDRRAAREQLELPTRGSLVVVSGGERGLGDLRGAVDTARHYTADAIVVLAGDDDAAAGRLRDAFGDDERIRVHGAADDMVTLLAAADILVHSTAGPLVAEARMCDCRVISYGWPHAHVRAANRAYERHGLAAVARNRTQLAHAIVDALNAPRSEVSVPELPHAADLVLGLAARTPAPVPAP